MTLPASGTIGVSDVNVELGKASNANTSLNDADARLLAEVHTGTIKLSDFYGKSLFSGTWSGNTYGYTIGMEVSGNLVRSRAPNSGNVGAWVTTNANGTFTGGPSWALTNGIWYSYLSGFEVSGSSLRLYFKSFQFDTLRYGAWLAFTIANKWADGNSTYTSSNNYVYNIQTSAGLLRCANTGAGVSYGAWVGIN